MLPLVVPWSTLLFFWLSALYIHTPCCMDLRELVSWQIFVFICSLDWLSLYCFLVGRRGILLKLVFLLSVGWYRILLICLRSLTRFAHRISRRIGRFIIGYIGWSGVWLLRSLSAAFLVAEQYVRQFLSVMYLVLALYWRVLSCLVTILWEYRSLERLTLLHSIWKVVICMEWSYLLLRRCRAHLLSW